MILTSIYNTISCVCMLVLSLIALSFYSVLSSFILSIVFVNSANALWCFLISISFFMGQLSVFATAAIGCSLSSRSIPHSSNM